MSSKSVQQERQARECFQECPAKCCCSLMTVGVISTKKRQVFHFRARFCVLCSISSDCIRVRGFYQVLNEGENLLLNFLGNFLFSQLDLVSLERLTVHFKQATPQTNPRRKLRTRQNNNSTKTKKILRRRFFQRWQFIGFARFFANTVWPGKESEVERFVGRAGVQPGRTKSGDGTGIG